MSGWEVWRKTVEFLGGRSRSYQLTFSRTSPAAKIVLADIAKFCRANETCFHADPRLHAVLEGRREVWLRITQHLNLTPEELYELYRVKTTETKS